VTAVAVPRSPDLKEESREESPSRESEQETPLPVTTIQERATMTYHHPGPLSYYNYMSHMPLDVCNESTLSVPPAPEVDGDYDAEHEGLSVPQAPEPLREGGRLTKGVPVPPAPAPHATGHVTELRLAMLEGGKGNPAPVPVPGGGDPEVPLAPAEAAPGRSPVACQSPIGEGWVTPRVINTNPQWKK